MKSFLAIKYKNVNKKLINEISNDENNFIYKNLSSNEKFIIAFSKKEYAQRNFFHDKHSRIVIFFHGDITNKNELSKSMKIKNDLSNAQTALECYKLYKDRAPFKLKGFFRFIIFNENDSSLFVANDHLGSKPLYFVKKII